MTNTETPKHVAIIMDGNGRWAKQKKLPLIAGHKAGANTVLQVAERAYHLGVEALTLYTFSSENWSRHIEWLNDFMGLLKWYLTHEVQKLMDKNIQLHVIGDISKFSGELQTLIQSTIAKTAKNTGLKIVLALSYGSRDEITMATKVIAQKVKDGLLAVEDIDSQTISDHLYTHFLPDPDLMIRTSGEHRLSNYLLWQMAYTEFVFHDKLWPDFTGDDFESCLQHYFNRDRRYGRYLDNEA